MPDVPQFAIPPRVADGEFVMVEQGDTEDIKGRVNLMCRISPGWLDSRLSFGLADQRFRRGGADVGYVANQLMTWIPDAQAAVREDPSALDQGLDYLGLQVRQ